MIENDAQLTQTLNSIVLLQHSLDDLRDEVLPHSRQWYEVMIEGPHDEIKRLQSQVDEYRARQQDLSRRSKAS